MVQIEQQDQDAPIQNPLGAQVAVGQSSVDSEAITEEAIAADPEFSHEDSLSNEPAFAGSESLASDSNPADYESDSTGSPLNWQSEKTQRSRQIAFVVAVSISGLLVAIAAFSWFVQSWRTPEVVAVTSDIESPSADISDPAEHANSGAEKTAAEQEPIDKPREPKPVASENPTDPSQAKQTSSTDQQPPAKIQDPTSPIPSDLMPQSPLVDPVKTEPQTEQSPVVKPKEDPASETDQPKDSGMQELPPGFARFTDFLLDEGSLDEPNLAAPPTIEDLKIQGAAEDDVDPLAAQVKPLNLRAELGLEIALSANGYPLSDLILTLSQMTGVPIQLDWVSFDLAGIPIDSTASAPKGWQSARNILEHVAEQFDAEIRAEELLVTFTPSDDRFNSTMDQIADLSDFGADKDSAEQVLAQFLIGADSTKLIIGESRDEKQLAALAIESLRRMRGIEPKVADEQFQHWARVSKNDTLDWPLVTGGEEAPTDGAPVALAGFLCLTARHNQSTCIVNWHDLNRRNVAPESLILPRTGGNAATALERSLDRFSIQVRQVDQTRWWVGSEHTYDQLPVVVWTSALGQTRDVFQQRLTTIMAAHPGKPFQMVIDQKSDRALLLLPRYIVRQLPKITASLATK